MVYKFLGFIFLALAALGAVLPILPTTPFVLVAASCFAKSSPYLHQKLLDNRLFGPLIVNWQQHKSIPLKAKIIALSTMLVSVIWSCFLLTSSALQIMVILLVLAPAIFIWRLPNAS
jgi:uncharacterized membrane protein YbaN (DUF454 family)